ncbi:class I SAM-dependent methyltransferase [Leeuwenhoekiella aequorea]|uniref:class I SAM-dependent methyltransferase n=1 Tax=Leeuwenhoekiella aequorea TaxID=283736 RepID=UPI00352F4FE5
MQSKFKVESTMKIKDFSVSKEEFNLIYNKELDKYTTDPIPNNIEDYYVSENYISHTDSKKTLIDRIYQLIKGYMLKRKLQHINRYRNGNQLLDIGAGTGDFLVAAKNDGWKVNGIEPSKIARKNAEKKDLTLFELKSNLNNQKFDLITMWHVLEHVPDLKDQLQWLVDHLYENGTLVIAVPNFNSYDSKHYKKYWAAWDVPRHIHHFSRKSMKMLFSEFGFHLIKEKPMYFDSYYVSLLSEKYKSGNSNIFKAIMTGFKSNWKARHSNEYSSIIYTFKKGK